MGCALLILFMVFVFTFSPWWLLAVAAVLLDDGPLIVVAVAVVLAITMSPWWLLLLPLALLV